MQEQRQSSQICLWKRDRLQQYFRDSSDVRSEIFLSLILFGASIKGSAAYSNGSVTPACVDMMPRHVSLMSQTSMPPFRISTSKSTYSPGDTLTVTLSATGSSQFVGFILQARVSGSTDPVGCFMSFNSSIAQSLDCNNSTNSTISHQSANELRMLEATWQAPSNSTPGDIMFCATFVKDFAKFWVNVNSPAVRMSSSTLNIPPSKFILLAVAGLLLKYN